ncbi:unnamed protein product [Toxocara canis]|uniref:MacB_PCD domain-containing protein n=1 Tax=Toxocara canis TaxID=6265 RepID=A0A183V6S7_TOXCA|nr:unnamed protein product [Toxocara canis]
MTGDQAFLIKAVNPAVNVGYGDDIIAYAAMGQATEYLQSGNPAVTLKIRPLVKEPDETVMRIDYVIVGDEIHALNRSFSVINDPLYAVSRVVQRAGSGAHTWIFASVLLLVIVTVVYTCILIYKNHNQRASYVKFV